jgi:hypothetical protein
MWHGKKYVLVYRGGKHDLLHLVFDGRELEDIYYEIDTTKSSARAATLRSGHDEMHYNHEMTSCVILC